MKTVVHQRILCASLKKKPFFALYLRIVALEIARKWFQAGDKTDYEPMLPICLIG